MPGRKERRRDDPGEDLLTLCREHVAYKMRTIATLQRQLQELLDAGHHEQDSLRSKIASLEWGTRRWISSA